MSNGMFQSIRISASGEHSAIHGELGGYHAVRVTFKDEEQLPKLFLADIPQSNREVGATGCKLAAIRVEDHSVDIAGMTFEGVLQCAGCRIPELDAAVAAPCR